MDITRETGVHILCEIALTVENLRAVVYASSLMCVGKHPSVANRGGKVRECDTIIMYYYRFNNKTLKTTQISTCLMLQIE